MKAIPEFLKRKFRFQLHGVNEDRWNESFNDVILHDLDRDVWFEDTEGSFPTHIEIEEWRKHLLQQHLDNFIPLKVVALPPHNEEGYVSVEKMEAQYLYGAHYTSHLRQFVLPTQFIMRKWGETFIPDIGRSWRVPLYYTPHSDLYYHDGSRGLLAWKEIPHEDVWVKEVWIDCGDDGHTEYALMGYKFLPNSQFTLEIENA